MFQKSDDELIQAALSGKRRAWLTLVKRHESSVYSFALRMTGNTEDAKDLLQDTFLAVCRSLDSYRGDAAFRSWLFRIAQFRFIEQKRRKNLPIDELESDQIEDDSMNPEAVFNGVQDLELLKQAVSRLPEIQKVAIELKFYQQFTFDEIAEQLGLSSNTVKSRVYTALGCLRKGLEQKQ